jgi:hypothetical protein
MEPDVTANTGIKDYHTIMQSALECSSLDASCLMEKVGSICVKHDLDVITKNIEKSWAPLKATVASLVAKLKNPSWDTRYHQTQIGGMFSLRTIDRCHVSEYLFKNDLYVTGTEFALTRSFEKAEPFTQSYTGKISPKECKDAFLNIVEVINTTDSVTIIESMLVYLMIFLKERKAKNTMLKTSTLRSSEERKLMLVDVLNGLESINDIGSGISVVPVLVVHTLLSVIQPYLFVGICFKELKEHTASDSSSHSFGDVEGYKDSTPIIAIEIKHKIKIIDSIVSTFDKKTCDGNIPLKYILTTARITKQFVRNNICIDTVSGFTMDHLQNVLIFEENICSIFVKELRKKIVSYHNIPVEKKALINDILTSLLAPASP